MPRRKILPTPQPVGDIIGRMIKREKWPVYREDRALLGRWERVVGETIARQTRPDRVTCGVLYVRVATSTWRQELHFLKGEILSGLNAIPGEEPISDIRFFLGEIGGLLSLLPPSGATTSAAGLLNGTGSADDRRRASPHPPTQNYGRSCIGSWRGDLSSSSVGTSARSVRHRRASARYSPLSS